MREEYLRQREWEEFGVFQEGRIKGGRLERWAGAHGILCEEVGFYLKFGFYSLSLLT